ncbi:MAG TPA: sulfotransferase, partial [Candidatus Dormibacteraeota bacterium]|nr:sulfotransferase [Candidatus Dormibacteraeota bacterium]
MISADSLLREASERSGADDWGDRGFTHALGLLVESGDAASLTPQGRRVLRSVALRHLRNRLLVRAYAAAHPEAAALPAPSRAIVVTGLPRTGTSVVHQLLALGTRARPLRLWEALSPVPVATDEERRARVDAAQAWLDRFAEAVPGFRRIHAVSGPEGAEECDALLQNSFASQHFDDMFDVPAYSSWLATADLAPAYGEYALQLRLLSSTDPPDRLWVLKSPSHLGHLDNLAEALPDAVVVHCHRPPAEAV